MTNGAGSLEADVVALLGDLVAIPSVNPAFRTREAPEEWFGEAAMAARVADWLGVHGVEAQLDLVLPGRPNVIARLRANGARRLLWEGHLDTVQATA
jgi:succinyl-diaminopimelate desuccinylase